MRPNTPHIVFTPEHSVCLGGHYYATSTMRDTCYGMIHSFISGSVTTNTEHVREAFKLLSRMVIFYHSEFMSTKGAGGFALEDMDVDLRKFIFDFAFFRVLMLNSSECSLVSPPGLEHIRRHCRYLFIILSVGTRERAMPLELWFRQHGRTTPSDQRPEAFS